MRFAWTRIRGGLAQQHSRSNLKYKEPSIFDWKSTRVALITVSKPRIIKPAAPRSHCRWTSQMRRIPKIVRSRQSLHRSPASRSHNRRVGRLSHPVLFIRFPEKRHRPLDCNTRNEDPQPPFSTLTHYSKLHIHTKIPVGRQVAISRTRIQNEL